MIFALSRRICPGSPYTPSWNGAGEDLGRALGDSDRGRWKLDECLRLIIPFFSALQTELMAFLALIRFATELAGRKARRMGWTGLADEMIKAGWFDT